jgi:hypothetical protein
VYEYSLRPSIDIEGYFRLQARRWEPPPVLRIPCWINHRTRAGGRRTPEAGQASDLSKSSKGKMEKAFALQKQKWVRSSIEVDD